MASGNNSSDSNPSKTPEQEVQHQIAEQVSQAQIQARKEEVLEIYEDLLQTIWNRIIPTLGRVTVMAIVERAVIVTQEKHPTIAHLSVTREGISFTILRQQMEKEERILLREALKELVAILIDILAMLTGDILVREVIKEMEGRKLL